MTPAAVTFDDASLARLRQAVLDWYDSQARAFEFRGIRDPYAILVSEVILQQTQASRGEPAWRAFMARFPTVRSLADAALADVLRQWSGLGYNRRALNLQRAARAIVEGHAGDVPDDLAALQALPGIGPYTARAVAAIAFGQPVGPVDTNIRRVLGRVAVGHGSVLDPGRPLSAQDLQRLADGLVPPARPADWTAALMDIGATLCRPRRPLCDACPLTDVCRFVAQRTPVVKRRPAVVSSGRRGPQPASGTGSLVERGRGRPARRVAESIAAYESSTRWLRGRIMARLSEAPGDAWTMVVGPLGTHDAAAVATALESLCSEGLAETDGAGRWRLPAAEHR